MDINYILSREQTSLHNAFVASSSPARIAHEGLAKAYGKMLAASTLSHRPPMRVTIELSIRDEVKSRDNGPML
jgi:hypothetical protein